MEDIGIYSRVFLAALAQVIDLAGAVVVGEESLLLADERRRLAEIMAVSCDHESHSWGEKANELALCDVANWLFVVQ